MRNELFLYENNQYHGLEYYKLPYASHKRKGKQATLDHSKYFLFCFIKTGYILVCNALMAYMVG
jgi:hypothetical protein